MSNPLTGLAGFRRAPGQVDTRTRQNMSRLAGLADVLLRKDYAQVAIASGDTIASTAAETAFASGYTYPANKLAPGNVIEIAARGIYSCVGPPTVRLKWKLGTTVILDTGVTTPTAIGTASLWVFEGLAIVQTVGAAGTIEAQGSLRLLFSTTTSILIAMQNTAVVTLNTTGALLSALAWTWGTSSASNTITQRMLIHKTLP